MKKCLKCQTIVCHIVYWLYNQFYKFEHYLRNRASFADGPKEFEYQLGSSIDDQVNLPMYDAEKKKNWLHFRFLKSTGN